METMTIKVRKDTIPNKLAGTIAKAFKNDQAEKVELHCIGANAINQATKAVAIAANFLEEDQIGVEIRPTLEDVLIEEKTITVIKYVMSRRES